MESQVVSDFSVVIPLYNKAEYITECLNSVLSQSLTPQQIIVVNDGSDDGGDEIVRSHFPSVQLINKSNQGVAAARNAGLQVATMPWVAFLDADDLWTPYHLEELQRIILEVPQARLVATQFLETTNPDLATIQSSKNGRCVSVDYFKESLKRRVVSSSTVGVHRDSILELGGFRCFKTGEDSDLWARMALNYPVGGSEKITAIYRRGVGGLMSEAGSVSRRALPGELSLPNSHNDLEREQATIVEAINAGSPMASEGQLVKYLDHLLVRTAKQRLARADTGGAKAFLRLVNDRYRAKHLALFLLSCVPSKVLWASLQVRRRSLGKR